MKFSLSTLTLKTTTILALIGMFASCSNPPKPQDPFEISYKRIGHLADSIRVFELDSIFKNDSIVKRVAGDEFINTNNEIEIYEKGGKQLLVLEAKEDFDTTATIESIRIIDPRFKTVKGLTIKSSFKDVKANYTISKISNTLSTALVFVDSLNIYFTIDKSFLPEEFRTDSSSKIETSQIPDNAKIKDFWIGWD